MIRLLQQNSSAVKFLFAFIIIAAIGTMVITLVPGIFDTAGSNGSADVFATVHDPGWQGRLEGGSTVKQTEVAQLAQRQLQQQNLPDMLMPYMEQRAGQILVQREILKHEADRMHLQVSDEDLRRELRTGAFAQYLFPNGTYIGDDAYINFVQSAFRTTRASFESQVKSDMELNRLQSMLTGGVNVSDTAVREASLKQNVKVRFDYVVVSPEDVRKQIIPTDAQLHTFFDQNKARYATAVPETRKIQYVAFDASNLPGGKPQVSDADLQAYYTAHQAQFTDKEQVKVRHILIAVPAGADAKADSAAKAKAEDLLRQIKAGGNFAELAAKNSDDPGSKSQGGELGFLDRGRTVPEFDKTAFSLAPGQTSDVIKTQFGYHILQVEEKKTARVKPLSEARGEILPILEQQRATTAEQSFASQLVVDASKNGIEKAAASKGLHAQSTDFVAKDGVIAGVADGTGLLTKAFASAKGAAPQSVATGDGFAVFQVEEIKPAHAPDFDSYKQHIADDFREQQVPQLMNITLNKLDGRAKALNDLRKAAAEANLQVKSSDLVGHDGQVPELGSLAGAASVVFTLPKGQISGPLNTGRTGAVLVVTDRQEPDPQEIAKNFNQTRDQLLNAQREEIFRVYLGNVTDKYQKSGAVRMAKRATPANASPFGQ
jgi:peptidyl-prolyl cis-trans isomerase D